MKKFQGLEHPHVSVTINNITNLYSDIEKYDEALSLFERSLKIFENKLGSAHPYFKMTEQNIQALKAKMEEK